MRGRCDRARLPCGVAGYGVAMLSKIFKLMALKRLFDMFRSRRARSR